MRSGRFHDYWRGNGWFAAFPLRGGWLLLAFRPKCWRLRAVRPKWKPDVTRVYIGPFEIERSAAPHPNTKENN